MPRVGGQPHPRRGFSTKGSGTTHFVTVAEGGAEAFYRGEIAKEIVRFSEETDGLITEKDLADFEVEWQDPISVTYKDYEVYCPPPPCSGFQYSGDAEYFRRRCPR